MGVNLSKIWRNRKLIFEGFWNFLFKKRKIEKIARKRMDVCRKCPEIDYVGTKCEVKGTHPCCGICGCSLAFKIRSIDEDNDCPMGYWNNNEVEDHEHYIY